MVSILKDIQHLVRYAHWAYMDDDGAEFRSAAQDLEGDVNYRKLKIVTPFFKDFKALTPNTHVHLGVRNGDTLVLAFRGTDFPFTVENLVNPKSWWGFWGNVVTDVAFRMVQIHWLPGDNPAILAHDGFLAAFNNLLKDDRLGSCILQLMGDLPPSKIEVCGHSLGGALATLCALWCRTRWHYANIKCVTLGSPRVGNEGFCQRFHSSAILCYRLEMDGDPIPTVPDRFTQAVPGKLPANDPSWTEGDRTYGHVGIPIILHGAGGRVIYNSVDYDVERPDIEAEKDAPPLPWQFRLPYEFGGFLPYWILRGLKMLPAIWQYHDPTGYETVVQRILERTGAPMAGRVNVAATSGYGGHEGKVEFPVERSVVDVRDK